MEITSFDLGIPLFKLEVLVRYQTPRKPTAFEWGVLQVVSRFSQHPQYKDITLERVVIDYLRVPDPGPLLIPTLLELWQLDCLRCDKSLQDLSTLRLQDISLTNRGATMLERDVIPGKQQQTVVIYLFDPIHNTVISAQKHKSLSKEPPKSSLESALFQDIFPEVMIRSQIKENPPEWYSGSTEIESLTLQNTTVLWDRKRCSVQMKANRVWLDSNDDRLSMYLKKAETEEMFTRLVKPFFDTTLVDKALIPMGDIELTLGKDGASLISSDESIGAWPMNAAYCIVGKNFPVESIPMQAPKHQAIIFQEAEKTEKTLLSHAYLNQNGDGCKIISAEIEAFSPYFMITDKYCLEVYRQTAQFGNNSMELVFTLKSASETKLSDLRNQLTNLINSLDRHSWYAARFLFSESEFLEWLSSAWGSADSSLLGDLGQWENSLSLLGHANLLEDKNEWAKALWKTIRGNTHYAIDKTPKEYLEFLAAAQFVKPIQGSLIDEFFEQLASCQVSSLDVANQLFDEFHELNEPWAPQYPSAFFSKELLTSYFDKFPMVQVSPWIRKAPFFKDLHQLQLDTERFVLPSTGVIEGIFEDEEKFHVAAKSIDLQSISEAANRWLATMDSLLSTLNEPEFVDATHLGIINRKIQMIHAWVSKYIGNLPESVKNVYIFDTCSLIEDPQIPTILRAGDMCLIPKRVIEELDYKKLDERLKQKVTEAIKCINKLEMDKAEVSIRFCEGNMELLPKDYQFKGDNLILSIAVQYRTFHPKLITEDNLLKTKAKAELIEVMSAKDLRGRPRGSAGTVGGSSTRVVKNRPVIIKR
ncbi:MAG: PIN domain-containing protein [Sphaerochaeta associata]|uniref:PIN domain-containing protein n=1 Tax=Sphaerochaeta associata TaxID=1129264 RepID=UPI002B1FAADE|nr:PIN domain-containing protein [Sphaerochaeta associata]MEA5029349.1 PIN domain-containing protein [Sphaerochaeta associata]